MEFNLILYILFIGVCITALALKLYKLTNNRCPKSGGNLSLDKVKDPAGINATKKSQYLFIKVQENILKF